MLKNNLIVKNKFTVLLDILFEIFKIEFENIKFE